MSKEVQAQAQEIGAEHGLGQRRDRTRPRRNGYRASCARVLHHGRDIVAEKRRQSRRRRCRSRVAKLSRREGLEHCVEFSERKSWRL